MFRYKLSFASSRDNNRAFADFISSLHDSTLCPADKDFLSEQAQTALTQWETYGGQHFSMHRVLAGSDYKVILQINQKSLIARFMNLFGK